MSKVVVGVVVALCAALLVRGQTADAADGADAAPPFVATGHSPTQGTPVPGAYLTADLGTWSSPPDSYDFQWLRDGTPIAGATARDYLVQPADIGHVLAPYVTGHAGADEAHFTGTPLTGRQLTSALQLDVRRVHPAPTKGKLVWSAVSSMSTERPWDTDGGVVVAYKHRHGHLKELARSVVVRDQAVVRLPWPHRAPAGRTSIVVCYLGSDVVAASCSAADTVKRPATS